MVTTQKEQIIDELRMQWKSMWRNRVDDKVRAEGIADKDYSLLFVDRGTVVIATRRFKLLDFHDILEQHKQLVYRVIIPPNPSVGGWGKFARTALTPRGVTRRGKQRSHAPNRHPAQQQLKKGGRGWLHFKR